MIEFLTDIDTSIFLAINSWHAPVLDYFMLLISNRFVWVPFYVVFALFVLNRYGTGKGLALLIATGLTIALADQICATIIRPSVARLRPANPENPISELVHIVEGYRGGAYGFPSCHAANTFAFAAFMSMAFPHRKSIFATLLLYAIINCWSRLYLGVHYPGDLLCGALVGIVCGIAMYAALCALMRYVLKTPLTPLPDDCVDEQPDTKLDATLQLLGTARVVVAIAATTVLTLLAISVITHLINL